MYRKLPNLRRRTLRKIGILRYIRHYPVLYRKLPNLRRRTLRKIGILRYNRRTLVAQVCNLRRIDIPLAPMLPSPRNTLRSHCIGCESY